MWVNDLGRRHRDRLPLGWQGHRVVTTAVRRLAMTFAVAVTTTLCIGCSSSDQIEAYRVAGVVSCDGNAVPTGQVTFLPKGSGQPVSSGIGPDGTYAVIAPPGNYKVTVIAIPDAPMGGLNKDNWLKAFDARSPKPLVPSNYGNADTSPISYTVAASEENEFDISIRTSKMKRTRR